METFQFTLNAEILPRPDPLGAIEIIRFQDDVFLKIELINLAYTEVKITIARQFTNAGGQKFIQNDDYFMLKDVPYYTYGRQVWAQILKRDNDKTHLYFGTVRISYATNNFA